MYDYDMVHAQINVSGKTVTDVKYLSDQEYEDIYFDKFDETGDELDMHCCFCEDCQVHMDYELYWGFKCPKCGKKLSKEKLCSGISDLPPLFDENEDELD